MNRGKRNFLKNYFKETFPQLQDVIVEWEESGKGISPELHRKQFQSFAKGNFKGHIPCSNPHCHEGGYEIESIISKMVKYGVREKLDRMRCYGWEESSKLKKENRCPNSITYRIKLTLR